MNKHSFYQKKKTSVRSKLLANVILPANVLAHQQKRFYNSATAQSGKCKCEANTWLTAYGMHLTIRKTVS